MMVYLIPGKAGICMKLNEISDEQIRNAVATASTFVEMCYILGIRSTGSPSLYLTRRIHLLKLDVSHLQSKRFISFNKIILQNNNDTVKKNKQSRKTDKDRSYWIFMDSKKSHKEHKFKEIFNLTIEIIEELIKNGCFYCGVQDLMMTLDRKQCDIGYVVNNVNGSCIRCNFMRRDMPYLAWLTLVPKIREMNEKKLFNNWDAEGKNRNIH